MPAAQTNNIFFIFSLTVYHCVNIISRRSHTSWYIDHSNTVIKLFNIRVIIKRLGHTINQSGLNSLFQWLLKGAKVIFQKIARLLKSEINGYSWHVGDLLPSEAELAVCYNVSRIHSVRHYPCWKAKELFTQKAWFRNIHSKKEFCCTH